MFSLRPQRLLGMTIEHQAITLAEVVTGRSPRVIRQDRFELPGDLSLDKPRELGVKLGAFLRQNRYTAKQVVVGLPGRLTLVKARTLPPCNAASAAAMLRLAIEREYHDSARDWAFDYLHQSADNQNTYVLLAAAPRKNINQIKQTLQAADLELQAVVPTRLSLANASSIQGDNASIYFSANANELIVWKAGRLVAIDRLIQSPQATESFAAEIKRALSVHGVNPLELLVHLDDAQKTTGSTDSIDDWQRALGLAVSVKTTNETDSSPAVAIATLWHKQPSLLIDFEHSRVEAVKPSRFTRTHALAAGLALLVLLGVGYLGIDWFMQWRAVNDLNSQLTQLSTQLVSAKNDVNRLTHARGWYDNRPTMLNSVRALTMAFPTKGQVWATSIIIRDDLTATLAAKATDEKTAINLIESLRSTPGFTDVKMLYLRQADRTTKTVSLAINYSYTGKD